MQLNCLSKSVISIVPRLTPANDGVGDYALQLAQKLYQDHGLSTHFIVGDPNWFGMIVSPGISVTKVSDQSTDALFALLTEHSQTTNIVLLQFSGYGYAKRSCCFWLIEALERWKSQTAQARIVTMFHEIYSAFGVPWKHHFWVSPIQRYLAARLMRISDAAFTNAELHAAMLQGLCPQWQRQIPILPVLSNITEPESTLQLSERSRRLVIFGQAGSRVQAYRNSLGVIDRVCRSLAIEQIIDIGQPTGLDLRAVGAIPLLEMGRCTTAEISQILQTSIAGFLSYDACRLAKSSIFAAYCANGLLPISASRCLDGRDNIISGKQYLCLSNQAVGWELNDFQNIADNAYRWYQMHNLTAQAKIFARSLLELKSGEITKCL